MEEVGKDERFSSDWGRSRNSQYLDEIIIPWISSKTVDEVIRILEEANVPCSRINTIRQAMDEPQFRDREILVNMEHPGIGIVSTLGVVLKLSETPGKIESGAPRIGADNDLIYKGLLGYAKSEVVRLRDEGII